uniref:Uncharacterized protein n=1 Tax=Micrurus corallinus TaxID=54390 RepID=A0A2D4GL28_MICCO
MYVDTETIIKIKRQARINLFSKNPIRNGSFPPTVISWQGGGGWGNGLYSVCCDQVYFLLWKENRFLLKCQCWSSDNLRMASRNSADISWGKRKRPLMGCTVALIIQTPPFLILRRVYVGLNSIVEERVQLDFWPGSSATSAFLIVVSKQ